MKLIAESTPEIVQLDGVQCRVWEGECDGVPVRAFIHRIAAPIEEDLSAFHAELVEQPAPRECAVAETWQDSTGRTAVVHMEELRRAAAELYGMDPDTWPGHGNAPLAIASGIALDRSEIQRLTQWVHDLQSGMWINCVYCGHRYGPAESTAPTMQEALYEHVRTCRKHPLAAAESRIAELESRLAQRKAAGA